MGTLPRWFGEVHPRFRTPLNSILFYAVAGLVLATRSTIMIVYSSSISPNSLIRHLVAAAMTNGGNRVVSNAFYRQAYVSIM